MLGGASGNILLEANVASTLAPLYALCDRWADAEAAAERVRARLDDVGNALARAGLSQMLGLTALLRGDPVTAERELRPTLDVLPPLAQAQSLVLLAEAVQAQGRLDEAEEVAARIEATDIPTRVRLARRSRSTRRPDRPERRTRPRRSRRSTSPPGCDEPNLQADALRALSEAQAARGAAAQARSCSRRQPRSSRRRATSPPREALVSALVSGVSRR